MAVVAAGLELNGVLDVLAGSTGLGGALAANAAWAPINSHGAKAASLNADGSPKFEMIGALNFKNGSTGLGLDLVCNQIAGTSGLEAQLALRTYAGLP